MEFVELSSHDEIVHDIVFDYYGQRFATCSSDKLLKVILIFLIYQYLNILFTFL
jgi:hypothetical protein